MYTKEAIQHKFTYHAPIGNQKERYEILREMGKALALSIVEHTPFSDEQINAINHLEIAIMLANAAIARNESE